MPLKSLLAISLLASAGAAQAVTWVSPTPGPDSGPRSTETTVVDFNTPSDFAPGLIFTGTTPGVAAAPAGDTTPYLAVNGTYTLRPADQSFDQFSFYWGSVDAGNKVEVLDLGNTVILTLTGAELPRFDGNQLIGDTNRRVYFDLATGETLGALRFSYAQPAFEIDDVAFGHSTAVLTDAALPEPSTWALLVIGFALVGVASRRRTGQLAA